MYEFKFLVSYIIIWPFFTDLILVIIEYVPYGDLLGYLRKSRGLNDTFFKDPDVKPQTSLTSQQLMKFSWHVAEGMRYCLLYTSPSPRDRTRSRMPSSA